MPHIEKERNIQRLSQRREVWLGVVTKPPVRARFIVRLYEAKGTHAEASKECPPHREPPQSEK